MQEKDLKNLQQKIATNNSDVSNDNNNVSSDNITIKTQKMVNCKSKRQHQGKIRCYGFDSHYGTND